jgi:hypothetical protein
MWLDVVLFGTAAFAGTPAYLDIVTGTFLSRLIVSVFAFPFLYLYLTYQNKKPGMAIEQRPVLAIVQEVSEVRMELSLAQREIERRIKAEREKEELITALQQALAEVRKLEGILPTCAYCKNIRDDDGQWHQLELYIMSRSEAKFSHGICPECREKHFPTPRAFRGVTSES